MTIWQVAQAIESELDTVACSECHNRWIAAPIDAALWCESCPEYREII